MFKLEKNLGGPRLFSFVALVALFTLFPSPARGIDYFIDSLTGSDSNAGTSEEMAWQTLSKVNSTTFQPGDRVLLKRGSTWTGQLNPKGSGATGNPILLDAYGEGPKPLIDGDGATGAGVFYLHNQEYWEVSNLELTNDAPSAGDRRGVLVSASNFGTVDHVRLINLDIHDIKGIAGQSIAAKDTGGIGFMILDDDTVDTRFNDVLIDGCNITTADNTGIFTRSDAGGANTPGTANFERRKFTNMRIRNNRISDIAKNAMIVRLTDDSCVVEYNVCWDTCVRVATGNTIFARSADGTVFQYNEGFRNLTTDFDGCLYDADLESPRTLWQYSYSHDNNHGLFWTATVQEDTGIVVRYNISQNDKGKLVALRSRFAGVSIYNNVFYIPSHLSPEIISERTPSGGNQTYTYRNNIVYNDSPTATYTWDSSNRTIDYNLFFGIHPASEPADSHKITEDPMFVKPGSGGFGIDTVDGYRLLPGSPAIDSATAIEGAPGFDFWGNPVPIGPLPDRGAHEFGMAAGVESWLHFY